MITFLLELSSHVKLSALLMNTKYELYISFGILDTYTVDVAESCIYSSDFILHQSVDLCTKAPHCDTLSGS